MARGLRNMQAAALCVLVAASAVYAQATTDDLPNLSTVTEPSLSTSSASSSAASSAATTSAGTSTGTTATTSVAGIITDAPDIGVGIPTLMIPDTAGAPFMQKSDLPEGTVFIAVGGVLAFLGACVLLWRGLVAWSVNRSVRRAAMASLRRDDKKKPWAPSGYNHLHKEGLLTTYDAGSTMSLDALTTAGKHIKEQNHRSTSQAPPPAGLFFSPTAQANNGRNSPAGLDSPYRGSTYLPAGYYASPTADRPAGGATSTTIGGSLAPYARHSTVSVTPPRSPELPATSRSTATYYQSPSSRDGLRPGDARASSRDRLSRDGYGPSTTRASALYAQPSTSSPMVGTGARQSTDHLGGSRAPSAYLDEVFDNHGSGPRERF